MVLTRVAGVVLALALAVFPAAAQYPPPPPGAPPPPPAGAVSNALYSPPQLDQMLAPIALYPDPLLTDVLTAATYPLEIVAAAQYEQAYPGLADGALAAAVANAGWDPSVQSLAAFPQVIALMSQHLDWTQAIGNAFLAQQADVMDSIQRLRHAAVAAGTLASSPYLNVIVDGPYIEIEPSNPQLVYVPVYNPLAVYGTWPYPTYQPYYFGAPPGLGASFTIGPLGFSVGFGIIDALWNWGDWDWAHHDITINRDRFARLEPNHQAPQGTTWQHDPAHRRGVPYRDAQSRAAYQRPVGPQPAETRQQYRFYPQQSAPQQTARPQAAPQRAPAPAPQAQRPEPQAAPQRTPAPAVVRGPPAAAPPPAFQNVSRGSDVRAEAARGASSRQTPPTPVQVARPAAQPHPAPPAAAGQKPAPGQGDSREERRP